MTDEPDVVVLTGLDLLAVMGAFSTQPRTVHVWMDPIDGGVKFKLDNGTWSPPFGRCT
jgi:hypothetical protein